MAVENSSYEYIAKVVEAQCNYFRSGATLDISFRKEMLKLLLEGLHKWEKPLAEALWIDLHKSYEEAYLTELSIVKGEIANHLRNLAKWSRRKRKPTPIKMFPSRSYIVSEPLGSTLIIAPWNYPVQLLLNPLVGAITAGCTAILKPSPYVPTVAKALEDLIADTFESEYVATVQGNRDVNTALLAERYDLIFFTGSPALGRTVMAAAAKNLTPVVLELGGKSPCIVDSTAKIKLAAKRIVFGKFLNGFAKKFTGKILFFYNNPCFVVCKNHCVMILVVFRNVWRRNEHRGSSCCLKFLKVLRADLRNYA